jgi:hypothetical protein
MAKRMVSLRLDPADATVARVREKLKLREDELDAGFGVVSLDPRKQLYAILVDESISARLEGEEGVEGTFSNPRIETFGPPKKA